MKFTKKSFVTYYAGKVEDLAVEDEEVKTKGIRNMVHFIWPENPDVSWHNKEDIMMKLPKPSKAGGTSQMSERLVFPCDYTEFQSLLK